MSTNLTRREFIKITGLTTAGMSLAPVGASLIGKDKSSLSDTEGVEAGEKRFPTYCEICFWKCAGWTHVKDGEPYKVIGHDDDPLCNGRLCPRGTGGIGSYIDEDRLQYPLIRVKGEDGKQTFRRASWDEAFDFIAKKLNDIKKKHGADTVALFSHGSGGSYWKTFLKAYGSKNAGAPSYAQCKGPREEAFYLTYGAGISSPERIDTQNAKCMVLLGSHIGENMHNAQLQEFTEMHMNGGTVITVDPRFSIAAGKSKYWLPIKPATDLALLLAWIHVIIYEGLYDKNYVKNFTLGFDQLKDHVKTMTPEWAASITNLDPEQIRKTAREMADAAPAVIVHPGRHVTWYGDDTQRLRAVAILNGILGAWGRRGGFYLPQKAKVPKFPIPKFPKIKRNWRTAFPDKFPFAVEDVSNAIVDASIPEEGRDYTVKGWIVNGTNLIHTLPDKAHTLKAIQELELMVVVDTMPADITGYADVVLPECTYLERYDDLRISKHKIPTVALRMPATEPKFESKPAWWMAKTLAEKMGLGAYFPWKTFEEYLDTRLKGIGSSLKEMQKLGVKTFKPKGSLYFADDLSDFSVDTESGKIELYSQEMANAGADPLPTYTPHEEPPEGFYRLNYGRTPTHTFGRTANNPLLSATMKENSCWIHPSIAKIWGIKNGQYIKLVNQDGIESAKVKARITERIRHDSIYMAHGFGHEDKRQSRASKSGASDSLLMTNVKIDPLMGGTGMRANFVTFKTEGIS
jgi:thiosulfate reductase/polysulfide reductase chain A